MWRLVAVAGVVLVSVAGCGWPRDAEGTLDEVRGGVLRVGITENPPWTRVADDGVAGGAEARLVERLAVRIGARIEWVPGSESTLMAALKGRVLDLVVGGLDARSPWVEQASLTRPYLTARTVVAVPPGVEVPENLDGVRVAVRAGTAEQAALSGRGAVPVAVPDPADVDDLPVVVDEWRVDELGLVDAGHGLGEREQVWAVPLGENGWQVEVERFLLALDRGEVERLLVEAERDGDEP